MITFLCCLSALIIAYFSYGRYLESVCSVNKHNVVPSSKLFDGVDYMPIPRWKSFFIQLLNIAGIGPIFGAVLGAAYGPIAFLWITAGGILMGAMHDFVAAMMSLRHNGASLPEIVGHYLGDGVRLFMRIFSVLLMVLVGSIFMSQPAELIAANINIPAVETIAFGTTSWEVLLVLGVILVYYLFATLLPIDKIIGKIYPLFGFILIFIALCVFLVLIFKSNTYHIPELVTFKNHLAAADKFPIMPMLFTTIACGAISGFHATQSPLMVRCINSESESRMIFYGAMITESIVALIWAAIAMAFWGNVEGLNQAIAANGGSAALLVDTITTTTLGQVLSIVVLIGIVACAITSGDTAFRSVRLIVADMFGVNQEKFVYRLLLCIPLFALSIVMIFILPFGTLWSYLAWTNQVMATITLWSITAFLAQRRKPVVIGLLPAIFMTYVCISYIFIAPIMLNVENRLAGYLISGGVTLAILIAMIFKIKRNNARSIY